MTICFASTSHFKSIATLVATTLVIFCVGLLKAQEPRGRLLGRQAEEFVLTDVTSGTQ